MSVAGPATRDWLIAAIAALGKVDPERVVDEACLDGQDLNLDSLDRISLSVDAEDAFAIDLSDSDLSALTTAAEAVALIDAKRGA